MKPLVSVIIPVYNICDYISKCLESVCDQSYGNLEIIVVDDGSTDGSSDKCDEFAKKDKRVRVYHKKNGGLSSARNFGILKAKGEFVALVDGDDYVRKDFIKKMVGVLDNTTDIVICGYNDVVPSLVTTSGKEATIKLLVGQDNLEVVAWNKLYRRELFNDVYYPEGKKHEDALTTYKLLALARKVKYVPESLYVYVVREGSIMDTAEMIERLKARFSAAEEAVKYFDDDAELKQAGEVAVLTSKYAFMDASIKGEIGKEYYLLNAKWVRKHKKEYKNNKYLTGKLKFYNFINNLKLYKVFRTIV